MHLANGDVQLISKREKSSFSIVLGSDLLFLKRFIRLLFSFYSTQNEFDIVTILRTLRQDYRMCTVEKTF